MTHKSTGLGGLLLTAALFAPGHLWAAPAVPAPGESIPEAPAKEESPLSSDLERESPQGGEERFTLSAIRVEHEGLPLSDEKIKSITDGIIGREVTIGELHEDLSALTRYAREKGYPAATAYIPPQTAVEGSLVVRIAPGRFGKITVENDSGLKDSVAEGILAGLHAGDIIKSRTLETALQNLRELSGIEVYGVLSPGREEGTSDLTVKVAKGKKNSLIVYTENYGSKTAGRYRYGLQGELGNLGGTGGRVDLGAMISSEDQHGYNISAEMPVGHSATKLGLGFSRSDYELGAGAEELGATGMANTYSIYGRTPLWNTSRSALAITYGFDYRDMTDELETFNVSWKKHSYAFKLGLDGMNRWPRSKTFLHYNLGLHTGKLVPDSTEAEELAALGDTKGHFTKGTLDVTAVQGLGKDFDLLCKLSAQKAGSNLDSSEHIYLGGPHGIRAYPQGEGSGDEGILGTMEFRWHTPAKGLTLSTYLDAGHIRIAHNSSESMTLKGWGVGITYSKPDDWFVRLDYARRIGSDDLMSRDAESRQQMWFMAGKIF